MYKRDIFIEIEKALSVKQVIVITGMRRVGKTTTLKYLLSKVHNDNKLFFDLERVEHRYLFNDANYENIVRSLEIEGLDLSRKAIIAIDEIQLVPNITSVIKYLYDTYYIKFIVTGSSSFYIKNHFTESLAGRKLVFEMTTLTFNEYLRFKEVKVNFPKKDYYFINSHQYNKLKSYYLEYLEYGGFPEVVLTAGNDLKLALLKDIVNSYLRIDIKFLADFTKVDDLYKVILLLTSRVGNKIDYTKFSNISGINRKTIKEYILFFEQTYLIKLVSAFVKNRDREIALQNKLYFTDNGFLKVLGKVSSGALLENSLANQLSNKNQIKYYSKKSGNEIDFIIDDSIALEIKETPSLNDLQKLNSLSKSIGIKESYLMGLNYTNPEFKNFVWAGSVAMSNEQ